MRWRAASKNAWSEGISFETSETSKPLVTSVAITSIQPASACLVGVQAAAGVCIATAILPLLRRALFAGRVVVSARVRA